MTVLGLLGLLLLVLANAFFVVAEYALVTAPRPALQRLARDGHGGARRALRLTENPVRLISTVQVGITALGIALGALGEPVLRDLLDPVLATVASFALAFLIVTYLTVVLGELVPKALALHRATALAMAVSGPVSVLERLLAPVIWVFERSARVVLRLLRVPASPTAGNVHTVEELRGIVAEAEDSGVIEEAEEEMLYNVFDFAEQEAADVMVPWSEVVTLDAALPARLALEEAMQAPHSRFPVLRGSLDDVAGVVHLRDLVAAGPVDPDAAIEPLARDLKLVPETKDVGALLQEMRADGAPMALVINEYGSTLGIVTLNDLIEEIVGKIEEEYGLPDESVQHLPDGRLRVSGTFTTDDFNETYDTGLPTEDYRTLGGLVFGRLGRAPERGDRVEVAGVGFEVEQVEGPRAERLLVSLP